MLKQTISHYRILNHLGTGLIGEVYLAEDTHLGRKVALILLPDNFTRDVERMQRLSKEARTLSSLNHPNIRMIYEVGHDKSQHFIVTEYVEGPTLRVYLSYTRMKLADVIETSLQVVSGLAAAHAAGVMHRDLKPENIVMRPDGFVKILDFGLAKVVEQDSMMLALNSATEGLSQPLEEDLNATTAEIEADEHSQDPYQTKPLDSEADKLAGSSRASLSPTDSGLWWMPGTTGYFSPEQLRGEPVDERSDIFSLGVVIYEMCTGRLPFEGNTPTGVLNSILQNMPPPVRRFMPEAPDELEWIINKALAKDRDERYQTAREWLNDLKRLKQQLDFEEEQRRYERPGPGGGRRSDRHGVFATSPVMRRESARESGRSKDTGSLVSHSDSSRGLNEPIDSIAILPLINASDDPGDEYLSDGITESIINTLSKISGLRVMALSTVFRYKNFKIDPLEAGRRLNVRAVLVGRLLQRGENIVIKTELVDSTDGALLWAEQYARKPGDIFELETDIAKQISDHLRVKISGEQRQKLAKQYTANPQAYDLYLKGRFFWNQRTPEAMKRGAECFVQAIKKDAGFALAYSGLADCYTVLSWYAVPPREFVPKARISVTKALEIDEQLPEAHVSLGFLTLWYDWDFFKAERQFLRAIELNPNIPTAHHWYAYNLAVTERMDEAMERMEQALRLDPLSLIIITDVGELFYRQRRYDEAISQYNKALEMDPQFKLANYWKLRARIETGKIAETIAELEAAPFEEGRPGGAALLAIAYARAGRHDDARGMLTQLKESSTHSYVPPYYLAMISAVLGDKDQAFAWLEKSYQERSGWVPWLKQDPLADSLRTDARFSDLLRRVGLKP